MNTATDTLLEILEDDEQYGQFVESLPANASVDSATLTLPQIYLLRMTGRCANGFERDGGRLVHAIKSVSFPGWGAALCGAKPGSKGNGWSEHKQAAATCPRCLRKLAQEPSFQL